MLSKLSAFLVVLLGISLQGCLFSESACAKADIDCERLGSSNAQAKLVQEECKASCAACESESPFDECMKRRQGAFEAEQAKKLAEAAVKKTAEVSEAKLDAATAKAAVAVAEAGVEATSNDRKQHEAADVQYKHMIEKLVGKGAAAKAAQPAQPAQAQPTQPPGDKSLTPAPPDPNAAPAAAAATAPDAAPNAAAKPAPADAAKAAAQEPAPPAPPATLSSFAEIVSEETGASNDARLRADARFVAHHGLAEDGVRVQEGERFFELYGAPNTIVSADSARPRRTGA